MSTTVTDQRTDVERANGRMSATLTTLARLARQHSLRLPTRIADNDADGQRLELAVPAGQRELALAWAAILGLSIVSDHRQVDGAVCVDVWTHADYGPVWLGWRYIRLVSHNCPPQPIEPLPAHLDPIEVAELVHGMPLLGDEAPEVVDMPLLGDEPAGGAS